MKPLVTVLAIGGLLLFVAAANVQDTPYTLRATGAWNATGTWVDQSTDHPGLDPSDTATMSNAAGYVVTVNGNYSYDWTTAIYNTTVRFDNDDGARTLTNNSLTVDATSRAVKLVMDATGSNLENGTWDVNGALTLTGGSSAGRDAEFEQLNGSVTPDAVVLDGDATDANGHAILDLRQHMTVAIAVTVTRYADIVIASDMTFAAGDMQIGDPGNYGAEPVVPAVWAHLEKTGAGDVVADSIAIYGGDSVNTIVTVNDGSIYTTQ